MTPEQRAKAVAERFAAELPCQCVPELERIVTSAIKRALAQQLAELEGWAEASAEYAPWSRQECKGASEAACSTKSGHPRALNNPCRLGFVTRTWLDMVYSARYGIGGCRTTSTDAVDHGGPKGREEEVGAPWPRAVSPDFLPLRVQGTAHATSAEVAARLTQSGLTLRTVSRTMRQI